MEIKIGQLYINKTYKYLLPCLKELGSTFLAKYDSVHKLAFGIHDCYLDGTSYEDQMLLYILCDKMFKKHNFNNFLNYVKHQSYYCTDYAFDDIESGRKHMIVIKFPEKYLDSYEAFVEGKYSKMYSQKQIDSLFYDTKRTVAHAVRLQAVEVMNRTKPMTVSFTKDLTTVLGTTLTVQDVIDNDMELDFPLSREEEFFNYRESEQ